MYNTETCAYGGYFERVATNMGFCLSFNSGKIGQWTHTVYFEREVNFSLTINIVVVHYICVALALTTTSNIVSSKTDDQSINQSSRFIALNHAIR